MAPNIPRCPQRGLHGPKYPQGGPQGGPNVPKEVPMSPSHCDPKEVAVSPRRSMSLRTPPGPSVPKEVHVLKSQCPQRGPNVPKEVHIPQSLRSQGGPCPKEVLMAPNIPSCPQGGPHVPKEVLMSPSPCVPKEVHVLKDVPKEVHVPKSFMSPRMSLRRSPCPQGGPQGCPCPCVAANTTMSIWCPPTPHPQSLGVSPCPIKVSP